MAADTYRTICSYHGVLNEGKSWAYAITSAVIHRNAHHEGLACTRVITEPKAEGASKEVSRG